MCMTLCNMICCRKVGPKDYNVFDRFFSNWYFIGIFLLLVGVQILATEILFKFFKIAPLSNTEWATAVIFGLGVFLVSTLLKLTPEAWVDKIPIRISEETSDSNDPIMRAFDKALKGKVDI